MVLRGLIYPQEIALKNVDKSTKYGNMVENRTYIWGYPLIYPHYPLILKKILTTIYTALYIL